jgi:hypothetical protein
MTSLGTESVPNQVYPYDASATNTLMLSNDDIFSNTETAKCPISTCTLTQSDCTTALVAPFNSLLSIEASTPWNIKVSQS